MGLFDRFKKKETAPASAAAKVQHSALFQILEKLKKSQGPAVMMELSRVLKDYVDKGTWVPMPVINDSNGSRLRIVESRGKPYAAMYSDQTEIKASGSIVMGILGGEKKSLEPPSPLKPIATAMASISVDFPVPFSPTKNVTGFSRFRLPSFSKCRTAGILNG